MEHEPGGRVHVVPDDGAARAAEERGADLGGAEPVDVDVGERARSTATPTGSPGRRARCRWGRPVWAATATGVTSSGSTKSRIERSCGARSQSTSMSGCTSPRLMRTESTYWTSPISPATDELPDPPHRWRVAVGVIAHEHQTGVLAPSPASFTASASDAVSGFSTRTCLPASRAARTRSKWVAAGVAIATAATAGSASTCS